MQQDSGSLRAISRAKGKLRMALDSKSADYGGQEDQGRLLLHQEEEGLEKGGLGEERLAEGAVGPHVID